MSITIATRNRRYTVKVDETESEELFNNLVLSILKTEQSTEDPEPVQEEQKAAVPEATAEIPPVRKTYRGFLYIRCDHCGERKAFCSKESISQYRCMKCGERTELEDMVELYTECECGKCAHYMTNMIDPEFDISCINCGNPVAVPVAVSYNEKKKNYETMR